MQRLIVNELGPVKHCELEIADFLVFTGEQASGKSTVAKSVFFFKSMKNLLFTLVCKKRLLSEKNLERQGILHKEFIKEIRSVFLQTFGSTWCMEKSMFIQYFYTKDIYIKISLKPDPTAPNYIWVEFSKKLLECLRQIDREDYAENNMLDIQFFKTKIDNIFQDDFEIVYIPAGRSMITLLSSQLSYLYSSMDDTQKRSMDYCTQNYLERILKIKSSYSTSMEETIQNLSSYISGSINYKLILDASKMIEEILCGEYRNVDGEERLQVSKERYIKINFASSGQQESLWILNVLFYYLLNNKKTYFIIEEPESHLFPNAQKLITEFISLVKCGGNQILITTHSPYILGTINNLLYANRISQWVEEKEINKIIDKRKWIKFSEISAFFMKDGKPEPCLDEEFESIENEVIDGASETINKDFDAMIALKEKYWKKGAE